jgi:hypothetical protein
MGGFISEAIIAHREHGRDLATEASHATKKLDTAALVSVPIMLPPGVSSASSRKPRWHQTFSATTSSIRINASVPRATCCCIGSSVGRSRCRSCSHFFWMVAGTIQVKYHALMKIGA